MSLASYTHQAGGEELPTAGGHGLSLSSQVPSSKQARCCPAPGPAWRRVEQQVPICGRRSPGPETSQRLPLPTASAAQHAPGITHERARSPPTTWGRSSVPLPIAGGPMPLFCTPLGRIFQPRRIQYRLVQRGNWLTFRCSSRHWELVSADQLAWWRW